MLELDAGHQVPVDLVDLEDVGVRDEEEVAGGVPAERLRPHNTEAGIQPAGGNMINQHPDRENILRFRLVDTGYGEVVRFLVLGCKYEF